jgi:hypothetical protein
MRSFGVRMRRCRGATRRLPRRRNWPPRRSGRAAEHAARAAPRRRRRVILTPLPRRPPALSPCQHRAAPVKFTPRIPPPTPAPADIPGRPTRHFVIPLPPLTRRRRPEPRRAFVTGQSAPPTSLAARATPRRRGSAKRRTPLHACMRRRMYKTRRPCMQGLLHFLPCDSFLIPAFITRGLPDRRRPPPLPAAPCVPCSAHRLAAI